MSSLSEEKLCELKKSVLLDKMSWLCEELGDPGRYFPELRSKRVLSVTDTQLIKSKPTDQEKIEEFVTLISKRRGDHGQHGLDIFIEALRKQKVHAHVARILVRALNRKKAEADRTNTPLSSSGYVQAIVSSPAIGVERAAVGSQYGYHHNSVHTSPSNGSDNSTSSSRYDVHPDHGPLPPNPPPTSMSSGASQPGMDDGNTHPQYGRRPPPPPTSSTRTSLMSPEEEVVQSVPPVNGRHSGCVEDTHSHCSDELGPQTVPLGAKVMTSMSTNGSSFSSNDFMGGAAPPSYSSVTSSRDSFPSMPSNEPSSAEVEQLRKILDNLKYEKKQLEIDHDDALRKIQFLQTENQQLKDQLALHRPSRLTIASPHHAHPYPSFPGPPGDFHAHRNYYRARNSSPSPGFVERDGPVLRPANSSGSLNSHGSRGSYNASESQV